MVCKDIHYYDYEIKLTQELNEIGHLQNFYRFDHFSWILNTISFFPMVLISWLMEILINKIVAFSVMKIHNSLKKVISFKMYLFMGISVKMTKFEQLIIQKIMLVILLLSSVYNIVKRCQLFVYFHDFGGIYVNDVYFQ